MANTIFDIAKSTGFSAMTVSRVLNEPHRVSDDTRKIIEKKIAEMGFTPHSAAKSLAQKRTNIIYVYIPSDLDISHPFVMQLVAAIGETLGESGYSFLLSRKPYTNESCDGVIATGLTIEEEARLVGQNISKPFMYFGNNKDSKNWVDVDNVAGGYMITDYMLKKGYKNLAFIGVNKIKRYGYDRYCGFMQCLKDNNTVIDEKNILMVNNNEQSGYDAAKKVLKNSPAAIVCATDLLAIGTMRAIKECNLQIPKDIAVSGYDGLGFQTMTYPHITTVAQPIYEVGVALAKSILDKIKGIYDKQEGMLIKPALMINESV